MGLSRFLSELGVQLADLSHHLRHVLAMTLREQLTVDFQLLTGHIKIRLRLRAVFLVKRPFGEPKRIPGRGKWRVLLVIPKFDTPDLGERQCLGGCVRLIVMEGIGRPFQLSFDIFQVGERLCGDCLGDN